MSEIHDLTYHGGGGFIYSEVWQMPIMTRRFHIRKINEFLEKKTEAEEKAMRGDTMIDAKSYAKSIQVPDFVSTVKKS
jgi:cephalosporin-C deacetylase-like acetyl esterase